VTVLDDLEQVAGLGAGQRLEPEVVEDEDVDARPACEQRRGTAVGVSQAQLAEQARQAPVERRVAAAEASAQAR
jgi:hypothetical protein